MSTVRTSPSTLFGGTWEQIEDRFLLAAGDTYSAGSIGGEATHKLTVDEMPKTDFKIPHVGYFEGMNGTGYTEELLKNVYPDKEVVGVDTDGASWHVLSTGGDEPHNNMPPYLAVYMWRRTA